MKTPPFALNASSKKWYDIRAEADGSSAEVYIYDVIDSWFGVSAKDFVREVAGLDVEQINLHIHSPGGSVYEGIAILNAIRQHKAHVTVYVDGLAASAASFIAMGGDEIVMGRNAEMMIHDASTIVWGDAKLMREVADDLDRISNNIASVYAERAGGKVETWRDAMLAETWYSAQEAVDAGLADRVDEVKNPKATNQFDLSVFAHAGREHAPAPQIVPRPERATAGSPPIDAAALAAVSAAARAAYPKPPAEPVETIPANKEGADTMSDTLIQGLRERLGIPADTELDEAQALAALDEALTERAEPKAAFTPPEGTVLIDEGQLNDLRADAAAGRQARDQQVADRRDGIIRAALEEGRISAAARQSWRDQLDKDEEGTAALLKTLTKNTVPVEPIGYTGGVDEATDEDPTYNRVFPKEA